MKSLFSLENRTALLFAQPSALISHTAAKLAAEFGTDLARER